MFTIHSCFLKVVEATYIVEASMDDLDRHAWKMKIVGDTGSGHVLTQACLEFPWNSSQDEYY